MHGHWRLNKDTIKGRWRSKGGWEIIIKGLVDKEQKWMRTKE